MSAAIPTATATERDRLVTEFEAAKRQYQARPWSHGAEVRYLLAAEAIRRHDETKRARRPH